MTLSKLGEQKNEQVYWNHEKQDTLLKTNQTILEYDEQFLSIKKRDIFAWKHSEIWLITVPYFSNNTRENLVEFLKVSTNKFEISLNVRESLASFVIKNRILWKNRLVAALLLMSAKVSSFHLKICRYLKT